MRFMDKIFGRSTAVQTNKAAASNHPQHNWVNRVTPMQAKATPRRYDRLAEEGYRNNVIAFRAINLVSRAVGSVPLRVHKGDERLSDHPLLALLNRPNPLQRGAGLLYNMTGYYLIAGNAYMLAVGPDSGAPKELWLMRPDMMEVVAGDDGLPKGFVQKVGAKKQHYAAEAVYHWKSFNPLNDWYGMAPLEAAAAAVDSHNEGSRWNLALIQNGGCPSGVLYQEGSDSPLTDQQFDRLKAQVNEHYTGAANAGRPLLLEGGLRWQEMSLSPKDMDWQTGKNMSAREIALAFGVAPQLVGIPDSQTYNNMAEARLGLWEEVVLPMVNDMVGGLNSWLAPRFGPDVKIVADLDDLPALEVKRAKRMERLTSANFLTINEKRAAVGLPPIDGGQTLNGDLIAPRPQGQASQAPASKAQAPQAQFKD